jgi:hypothetical protein
LRCLESERDLLKQDTTPVNIDIFDRFSIGTPAAIEHFTMTNTLLLAAGVIFLSGLIAELFLIATAPVGYQDENGFHVGTQASEAPAAPWRNPG